MILSPAGAHDRADAVKAAEIIAANSKSFFIRI
jgi:hypothetical protein